MTRRKARERLQVALTDNGSIAIVPALTQCIRTAAPDITLEIVAWHDRSSEDVEAGKIDLALSPLAALSPLETEEARFVEPPPEIKSFQYFMVWHPRLTAKTGPSLVREQLRIVAKTI